MKKINAKNLISSLLLTSCMVPMMAAAQPFKAQYENYDNIPKSLKSVLETGSNYDSGYAVKDSGKNLRTIKANMPAGNVSQKAISAAPAVISKPTASKNIVRSSGQGYVVNGHTYSEVEAKNSRKLGAHALSNEAIVGAAPTLPVRAIEVNRDEVYNQKEGRKYIVDDDGSRYEVRGQKVNIHDGQIFPEGYQIERKSIKIPAYKLKGVKTSVTPDVKKNSKERLKINFLRNLYRNDDVNSNSQYLSYQIASSDDGDIFYPSSMRNLSKDSSTRSVVSKSERRPVVNNGARNSAVKSAEASPRRPANISFNYSDQADYMSSNSNFSGGRKTANSGVLSSVVNSDGEIYKMEELLAKAYQKNPVVNSSREALKAADESVPQAFAGYLPNISGSLSKSYSKSKSATGPKQKHYPDSQSLNLNQSIFGGGETYYAVEAAKSRILAARNELKSTEQSFLLEAINAYIELIFTKKVLVLAENNEGVLAEQLKASKERFVIGDATRTDVAQSEARLANAVSNRVISNGDYVNAKSIFKRVFLMEPPEYLPMPTSLPDIPETFDDVMSRAVANNPDVNRAKHFMDVRESEISVNSSQLYPQLDLTGSISKRESVSGNSLFETDSESLGLNLTIPLYNQGTDYSRIREAKDRRKQSEFDYQSALNDLRDNSIQSWQALTTTASNIEATKASLVASEYALEGAKEEQKEGVRTILDVLNAEQERFQSEVNHARAIKDSVLAVYRLKSVIGELTPEALSLPVRSYNPKEHYNGTKNKLIGL